MVTVRLGLSKILTWILDFILSKTVVGWTVIQVKTQPIDANLMFSIPQFRALSHQLYQTPDHHEFVREQIISQVININPVSWSLVSIFIFHFRLFSDQHPLLQLKSNRDAYDGYVPMAYDEYLDKVSRYAPQFKCHSWQVQIRRMWIFLTDVLVLKLTEMVNGVTMWPYRQLLTRCLYYPSLCCLTYGITYHSWQGLYFLKSV
jgi:hypothetical protein